MRIFFPLAALHAVAAVLLWAGLYTGLWPDLPGAGADPFSWHRHEMIFGFLAATLAGFVLTAVPNWTRTPPPRLPVLIGFASLWLAARILAGGLYLAGEAGGLWYPALAIGPLFYLLLAGWAGRRILAAGNRNLPVVAAIAILGLADLWDGLARLAPDSLTRSDIGWRLGLAIMLLLIGLIGGRITPAFTRNWLAVQGDARAAQVVTPNRQDALILLATTLALGLWVARPLDPWTGWPLVFLGGLHLLRMSRWQAGAARGEPLLFVLHLGYAWYAVGFLLTGAALVLAPQESFQALHAWTVGAIGTMTLAVMTRAALGHSGEPLVADGWMVAMFVLVTLAALLRLAVSLTPMGTRALIHMSATAWALAYLLYLLRLGPVLLRVRPH